MPQITDLTGKTFNRLTVLNLSQRRGNRNEIFWDCKCSCGQSTQVKTQHLKEGKIKSCGCYSIDVHTKHGFGKAEKRQEAGYNCWDTMIQRCCNPENTNYYNYGGRGITVCERWKNSFKNFIEDMGARPKGKTLDRYPDQNGNYEPSNCRWATEKQQKRNMRNNNWLEYGGLKMIFADWARCLNIKPSSLQSYLKRKNIEQTITWLRLRSNGLSIRECHQILSN